MEQIIIMDILKEHHKCCRKFNLKRKKKNDAKQISPLSSVEQIVTDDSIKGEKPYISIVIPTYNNAHSLHYTLERCLDQKYCEFEIIIVDAHSQDRTLDTVKLYSSKHIRIYSVAEHNSVEMLNKGISLANGTYVSFLQPGDFYISTNVLNHVASIIVNHDFPDLVYGGSLLSEGREDPKILLNPLSESLLKRGMQPTALQSCWFRRDALFKIGKFDSRYKVQSIFDLVCRLYIGDYRVFFTNRILVDDERIMKRYKFPVIYLKETWSILKKYFSIYVACSWLLRQKPRRMMRYIFISIKDALLGKR